MNARTHDLRTTAATANRSLLAKMLHALIRWWRDRREAARLLAYPDYMLKDIGISRAAFPWAVRCGRRERTQRSGEMRSVFVGNVSRRAFENEGPLEEKSRSRQRPAVRIAAYGPPDSAGGIFAAPFDRTMNARRPIALFRAPTETR